MNDVKAAMRAKQHRDTIRAALTAELRRMPNLSEDLQALLKADEDATQKLQQAVCAVWGEP